MHLRTSHSFHLRMEKSACMPLCCVFSLLVFAGVCACLAFVAVQEEIHGDRRRARESVIVTVVVIGAVKRAIEENIRTLLCVCTLVRMHKYMSKCTSECVRLFSS